MATLDGEQVKVGDTVFGVGYGPGKVVEILTDGRFRVQYYVGSTIPYDSEGVRVRMKYRSVYWHDPVVVPPTKDEAVWHKLRPTVMAVIELVRGHA